MFAPAMYFTEIVFKGESPIKSQPDIYENILKKFTEDCTRAANHLSMITGSFMIIRLIDSDTKEAVKEMKITTKPLKKIKRIK